MNSIIHSNEKRSIIVVGKTGAGKSKLLNGMLGVNFFEKSPNPESCTNKVLEKNVRLWMVMDGHFRRSLMDGHFTEDAYGRSLILRKRS